MIGHFIIKRKVALLVVESLLKEIDFQTATAMHNDPHHIMSIRIQVNKNKPFEHQELEGLYEKVNWSDYPSLMQDEEVMHQDPPSLVKDVSVTHQDQLAVIATTEVITPIAIHL